MLICAGVPVIVTLDVPLVVTVPEPVATVNLPCVTDTVVVRLVESLSATLTVLPAVKLRLVSSSVVTLAGVVFTGALPEVTLTVTVAVALPPLPSSIV